MKKCLFALCLIFSVYAGNAQAALDLRPEVVDKLKPKLNSDRIEYFYGNYGVDKLEIDSSVFPESRIANLHSIHDGIKVMRTLAIVDFNNPMPADLSSVHSEIMEGKSIGIALRDAGWTVHKKPVYFGVITLSPQLMEWMKETSKDQSALHIYNLEVSKQNSSGCLPYCTIIELHSPQYLTSEWLRSLYEEQYEEFSILSTEASSLLHRLTTLIQEFPAPVR